MRLAGGVALAALVLVSTAGATSIGRVTLPRMERSSTVILVADVEGVARRGRLDAYRLRPVRFLRGGPAQRVTVSVPRVPLLTLGVERGGRYLVFAERRTFFSRWNRLTVTGYHQGVYRLLDDGHAINDANGFVAIDRLTTRLRRPVR